MGVIVTVMGDTYLDINFAERKISKEEQKFNDNIKEMGLIDICQAFSLKHLPMDFCM